MAVNLELRKLLLKLPNGKKFEELIVLAIEKVIGRRVWSARSGSQFGADMGTGDLKGPVIRLEAKRYEKGTNLKKRELLGEISEAKATTSDLDLWILATSAEVPQQLEQLLIQEGKSRGIGIEIMDISSSPTCKLPRLLACALDEVSRFLQQTLGQKEAQQARSLLENARESNPITL